MEPAWTDDPAYDDQATLSPDGNRIAFVTTRAEGRANLWILDLKTRQATPLTSGAGGDFRPAWSPRRAVDHVLVRPRKFNGVCEGTMGAPALRRYLSRPA
jgi:Tol biopolymer transport system component